MCFIGLFYTPIKRCPIFQLIQMSFYIDDNNNSSRYISTNSLFVGPTLFVGETNADETNNVFPLRLCRGGLTQKLNKTVSRVNSRANETKSSTQTNPNSKTKLH